MNKFWKAVESIGVVLAWMAGIVTVVSIVGFIFFRIFWVTSVEKHEYAYRFNRFNGEIETFTNSGWYVSTPVKYSVYTIDCRPMQLTISANQRVLNAKLVRFNPKGIETFIKWHGMGAGSGVNAGNLGEILKCYAFDTVNGADCPFLEVISDIKINQSCPSDIENK